VLYFRLQPGHEQETAIAYSVSVQQLTKAFGKRQVIRGLDLEIPEGSMYGLVGPNGAGKTTLFRILVGLTKKTGGQVRVLDNAPGAEVVRRATGYMTQAEALYQDLSISENVRFFGRLYGLSGAELDKAVDAAVELVDLKDRADSRVDSLSGGMRRRTSLACAVVHRPKLLLLDEPTVGVDPELRATFWDAFAEWGKQGTTLVVSTHHLDEASRCHTLGLLREGTLIAEGAPGDLLEQTGASTVEEAFLAFAARGQKP
jgi:ABC-2 type transport system ATP-binding protein